MSKILVVEDEKPLLKAIETKLKIKGHDPIGATTGEEALEKLNQKPDLIWLDLLLPKMQGLDFLETLRTDDKYASLRDTPVIIISNSGSKEKVDKAFDLNVVNYLVKAEYGLAEIIKIIEETLSNK